MGLNIELRTGDGHRLAAYLVSAGAGAQSGILSSPLEVGCP